MRKKTFKIKLADKQFKYNGNVVKRSLLEKVLG